MPVQIELDHAHCDVSAGVIDKRQQSTLPSRVEIEVVVQKLIIEKHLAE